MNIVTHHEQLLRGESVKIQQGTDSTAAQIHVRLGLDQQERLFTQSALGYEGLEFFAKSTNRAVMSKCINDLEAHIVACSGVALAGIA
jgi:hypothetical protein